MARAATSRKRNIPGLGWLTTKRETYRRDVAGERADRQRAAKYDAAQEKKRLKEQAADQIEIQEQFAFNTGARHKQEGKKPHPEQGVLTSPQKFIGVTKTRAIARREYMKGYRQNPECARTLKSKVSDRAKRYRANQPGCKPAGAKQCKLCKSKRFLTVDHVDGNESNGKKSNLRWLCKSCNTRLGSQFAKEGRGRRTVQFNPKKGARSLDQWSEAVATLAGQGGGMMTVDQAREIVRETSARKRSEFNEDVWRIRKERYGPSGRKDGGAGGGDMPDWVTNPEASTEYRLGYNIGQMDRQNAAMHRTARELLAAFEGNFGIETPASSDSFEAGYNDGYGLGHAVGGGNAGGQRCGNPGMEGEKWEYAYRARKGGAWRTLFATSTIVSDHGAQVTFADGRTVQKEDLVRSRSGNPITAAQLLAAKERHIIRLGKQLKFASASEQSRIRAEMSRLTDEVSRYSVEQRRKGKNPTARRNPDTESEAGGDNSEEYRQAVKTAELFHGRPVVEHITITENIKEHDWYVRIGPLVSLVVKPLTKKPRPSTKLPFHQSEKGMVHLFVSPDGRQFYLRGGDQELDLDALGMGEGSDWYRDLMLIGEAKEITYRDKKKFHKFKLTDYYHKLGEETGQRPTLAYDSLAHKMTLMGGQYKVEMEDLVEDMSPGIVN